MILVEGENEVASKEFRNIAALATNYNDNNKEQNDDIDAVIIAIER